MNELIPFMVEYGYAVVFAWVFAEQLGFPVPSTIALVAAGALAGSGELKLVHILFLTVLAAGASDLIWYETGRRKGIFVLRLLCKISLEPDSCVRRTEMRFARSGARTLLIAKFIPGLSTAAPPLAGMFRMPIGRFLAFDLAGALIWAMTFVGAGYLFSRQLERVAAWMRHFGIGIAVLAGLLVLAWMIWKFVRRQLFLRDLRIDAVSPEDLIEQIRAGQTPFIADLRHELDFTANPFKLPGAVRMEPESLLDQETQIPGDQEIVLYCTCPNQASSARIALMLRRRGVRRVRPLAGGLQAWLARGYPVEAEGPVPADPELAGSPPAR